MSSSRMLMSLQVFTTYAHVYLMLVTQSTEHFFFCFLESYAVNIIFKEIL